MSEEEKVIGPSEMTQEQVERRLSTVMPRQQAKRLQLSNTQRKKQKRMAKQGKTTGSFMGPKLATLMHRGFMINMQPSVAATVAAAMSLDGPWRLYNDLGLVPGSECPTESLVLMLAREREETGLAGTNERTMAPWRQDGIGKCLRLVALRGDAETPEDKVFETLQVGYRLAYGDDRMDVCLVMSALLAQWHDYQHRDDFPEDAEPRTFLGNGHL